MPVYNYFLGNVDLLKTVAHRSLRSLVMPLGMVLQFFSTKNNFLVLYLPVFLSVNRTVYVYAVQSGYVACAALDYFIYPFLRFCSASSYCRSDWVAGVAGQSIFYSGGVIFFVLVVFVGVLTVVPWMLFH